MLSRYGGAPVPVRGGPQNGLYWNSTWASQYTTFCPSFWWLLLFARAMSLRPESYVGSVTALVVPVGPPWLPGFMSAAKTKSGPSELLNLNPPWTAAWLGNGHW